MTQGLDLECRIDAPSFTAHSKIEVGGNFFIRVHQGARNQRNNLPRFWDIDLDGDIKVGGCLTAENVSLKLPSLIDVGKNLTFKRTRTQSHFPSLLVGDNVSLRNVSGMKAFSHPSNRISIAKTLVISGCPHFTDLGTELWRQTNTVLMGNKLLRKLPRDLTLMGNVVMIGNRISTIEDNVRMGNLSLMHEPITSIGRNFRAKTTLLANLPNFFHFEPDAFVDGNLVLFALPKFSMLPASITTWDAPKIENQGLGTGQQKRTVDLWHTDVSLDDLRRLADGCANTDFVTYSDQSNVPRDSLAILRNTSTQMVELAQLPTRYIPIEQHRALSCAITLDTLEELLERGTAVAIGEGEQLRVYDFPSFIAVWPNDGRDPASRQIVTPFDLFRVITDDT